MVDRRERRALPALEHVVGPKVVDHINAGALGKLRAIAQLHGQAPFGTVQYRLAVEPDHVDVAGRQSLLVQETALDRIAVRLGQGGFGGAEGVRSAAPVVQCRRRFDRAPQEIAQPRIERHRQIAE